jgi:hypothetical protein
MKVKRANLKIVEGLRLLGQRLPSILKIIEPNIQKTLLFEQGL